MKASILVGPKRSQVQEVPRPALGAGDVLVRVKACGVCRSELEEWQSGRTTHAFLGHEPSGVVEAVGSAVTGFAMGERVAVFTGPGGDFTQYTSSGYGEYVVVPQENTVEIPDGVAFEHALGEPIACLVSAFERTPVALSDRVLVIGCGFMGLGLLQLLRLKSPRELVAVDVDQAALERARKLGADRTCTPDQLRPARWWEPGEQGETGFDVVVEATGAQKALDLAGEVVRAHGTLVILGAHGMRQVDVGLWNIKALTVINAHEKRRAYFMQCMRNGLQLIAKGQLDMGALVSHRYALDGLDGAFEDLLSKKPGHTKGVVLI
jgi:threonine dehydrogenase-like Zn-dependent dehydrogenase